MVACGLENVYQIKLMKGKATHVEGMRILFWSINVNNIYKNTNIHIS